MWQTCLGLVCWTWRDCLGVVFTNCKGTKQPIHPRRFLYRFLNVGCELPTHIKYSEFNQTEGSIGVPCSEFFKGGRWCWKYRKFREGRFVFVISIQSSCRNSGILLHVSQHLSADFSYAKNSTRLLLTKKTSDKLQGHRDSWWPMVKWFDLHFWPNKST